jgi:CBS domain-containing protein
MLKAKDVMSTNIVTVARDTDIYKAVSLMVENNITGLPVINNNMTLAGIVSEKDVLKLLYNKVEGSRRVEDFMTKDVMVFDQEDSLLAIADCLRKNRFRRVPIVSDGKLVGIVSRKDIISYMFKARGKDKLAELSCFHK